ncbi:hypothetical protein Tco_0539890 [Tanacetum coccineum]
MVSRDLSQELNRRRSCKYCGRLVVSSGSTSVVSGSIRFVFFQVVGPGVCDIRTRSQVVSVLALDKDNAGLAAPDCGLLPPGGLEILVRLVFALRRLAAPDLLVAFVHLAIPVGTFYMEKFTVGKLGVNSDCLPPSIQRRHTHHVLSKYSRTVFAVNVDFKRRSLVSQRVTFSIVRIYRDAVLPHLSLPPLRFSQGSCPELFSSGGGLPSRKEIFGSSRPDPYFVQRCLFVSSGPRFRPEVFGSPRPEVFGSPPPEVFGLPRPEVFGSPRPEVFACLGWSSSGVRGCSSGNLRPRLPGPNFRMINLQAKDTAIGIYSRIFYSSGVRIPFSSFLLAVLKYFKVHISQLVPLGLSKGDWFSFAKRGGPAPVCMEVAKSRLKLWKDKFFLIDRRAIPFHMPWRHPDSFMSIHAFLCMPSLDKVTVREEPHELGTSILSRVVDRTTSHVPAGTVIPPTSPEEIAVTRPDRNVVTKTDRAAKRKASPRPEISTNTAKRTRLSQKVYWVGSSGLAARDGVKETNDGILDDDGQCDGPEFSMEDNGNLNDVNQGEHINVIPLQTFDSILGLDVTCLPVLLPDKEVEAHAELSGDVRRTTRASVSKDASSPTQGAMPAPDTQPLDTDAGADEIASDGNVDPYFDARVSNTAGDVLERDLLPFVPGPYYIPYPFDEGSGKLYKDPKVCRIALDRFPTPAETHRLRELSLVELFDRMSIIKKQSADLKQQSESIVRANEEVSRLKAELGALKSKCEATEQKLSSWDKKHRRYRSERDMLATEKAKIEKELVETKSYVGVERGLRMDRTDEEFKGLSQEVAGFIPDAKEKFDRVIVAFPHTTFPFLDKVSQHSQSSLQDIARLEPDRMTLSSHPSSATASLRTTTHVRYSTSSFGTFGHTGTLEHLKKKKKPVEKGGPSAA